MPLRLLPLNLTPKPSLAAAKRSGWGGVGEASKRLTAGLLGEGMGHTPTTALPPLQLNERGGVLGPLTRLACGALMGCLLMDDASQPRC
jgi:hypothetical protein